MATFEAGRLQVARGAVRELRGARHLPLYVAAVVGGIAVVVGAQLAAGQVALSGTLTPSVVQRPVVITVDGPQMGQPARVVERPAAKPVVGGTLDAEVLSGASLVVPAPIVLSPEEPAPVTVTAPVVPVVLSAPSLPAPVAPIAPVAPPAPPAAAPLDPPQAESAPALAVPETPAVPVVAAPPPAPAQSNFYVPPVASGPMTDLELRLFDGLNAQRAAAGLPPYAYDAGLSTIARTRSQQMVDQGYFGHKDPFGYSMYVELLKHFGYKSYAWAGENLAVNNYALSESPERAVTSLMNSPTHKANILQTLFTRVGIGEVTHPDGRKYYSMIFLG